MNLRRALFVMAIVFIVSIAQAEDEYLCTHLYGITPTQQVQLCLQEECQRKSTCESCLSCCGTNSMCRNSCFENDDLCPQNVYCFFINTIPHCWYL